jgi:tetratricopeptide (TPR) repeat protein
MLAAFAFAATSAGAQQSRDWKWCSSDDDPDLSIRGCTALIKSGRESRSSLALDYYNRGNSYLQKEDNDDAIADYTEVIRLDPKNVCVPCTYNGRASAWSAKGDFDRALADYNQAIRLDPKDAKFPFNRGVAWWFLKQDPDRAMADFTQAIRLDPTYAKAFLLRGMVRYASKDYDGAIADFSDALRLDPKLAEGLYGRGLARRRQRDSAGAEADIAAAKAISADVAKSWEETYAMPPESQADTAPPPGAARPDVQPPVSSTSANAEIEACTQSDSEPASIAACTKLIESKRFQGKKLAELYFGRGMKYRFSDKYRSAIKDMDLATRLDPAEGQYVWGRGCSKIEMGDKRGGNADLARAKQLGFALDKEAPCGL